MKLNLFGIVLFVLACQFATNVVTQAQFPVDLTLWSVEPYPAPGTAGIWEISTSSARETLNGWPTLLYSDFPALWTALEVHLLIESNSDNDYVGFAIGFEPGDTSNLFAEYVLIDWKNYHQGWDFPAPSCTPGSMGHTGMAASQVLGVPTADEFWGHVNFDAACSDLDSGLQELARASTFGWVGWPRWVPIHFRIEYTPTTLEVYVDDNLEIDLTGTFGEGRWAFYDFSQAHARFANPTVESLALSVDIDIKPGSYPNSINPNAGGVIPVAILGVADFDATAVDASTVALEGAPAREKGKSGKYGSLEDVDGDAYLDFVVEIPNTINWADDATEATLTGLTCDGVPIQGTDSVRIVPPEP